MKLEIALQVLERGRAAAARIGAPMSLAVADAGGNLVALTRMDGASFLTTEIATSKAWTAAAVRMPTVQLAQAMAGATSFLVSASVATHGRFILSGGGYPITAGGEVIGGVGASGGSTEQDDEVAAAAAA